MLKLGADGHQDVHHPFVERRPGGLLAKPVTDLIRSHQVQPVPIKMMVLEAFKRILR